MKKIPYIESILEVIRREKGKGILVVEIDNVISIIEGVSLIAYNEGVKDGKEIAS